MSTPLRVDDFSVWIHGRKRRKMGRWEKRIGSLHAEWFHDHDHWMEVCLSILIPIAHFRTELSVHCQQNSSSTVKDIAASRWKVNTSFSSAIQRLPGGKEQRNSYGRLSKPDEVIRGISGHLGPALLPGHKVKQLNLLLWCICMPNFCTAPYYIV